MGRRRLNNDDAQGFPLEQGDEELDRYGNKKLSLAHITNHIQMIFRMRKHDYYSG